MNREPGSMGKLSYSIVGFFKTGAGTQEWDASWTVVGIFSTTPQSLACVQVIVQGRFQMNDGNISKRFRSLCCVQLRTQDFGYWTQMVRTSFVFKMWAGKIMETGFLWRFPVFHVSCWAGKAVKTAFCCGILLFLFVCVISKVNGELLKFRHLIGRFKSLSFISHVFMNCRLA